MKKSKSSKKKIVVSPPHRKLAATQAKTKVRGRANKAAESPKVELVFNKQNYLWMGVGVGLIALGLLLMVGGAMPSPDVWDDSLIYSWRRTVLAPFLILLGLVVEIYAIFKKGGK